MSRDQELIYGEVSVLAGSEQDCRKLMRVMLDAIGQARLRFDAPQPSKEVADAWIAFGELEAFVPIPGAPPPAPPDWRNRR